MNCSNCGADIQQYWMCDLDTKETFYCTDCFLMTPCGKEAHGEGCATSVACFEVGNESIE